MKYNGEVEVLHLLEILKNEVGFDQVSKKSLKIVGLSGSSNPTSGGRKSKQP
ncbi:unnamed protein product [marine sediment metagenome]|uniref:Uncharacterized protein n=1 Tax=marine sediment metagenome TaxID=412755 RepID=X0ZLR5_9ZZZZ